MFSKAIFFLVVVVVAFTGCGGNSVSKSDVDFGRLKNVKSKYSNLQFSIPANWIELSKTETSFFDICVVDELYGTAIYLVPLIIDFEIKLNSESENLEQIVYYSQLLKEAEYNTTIDKEEIAYFSLNNIQFASYEFSDGSGSKVKTVVFEHTSGPQELTFRKINFDSGEKTYFDAEFAEKIILNSIQ